MVVTLKWTTSELLNSTVTPAGSATDLAQNGTSSPPFLGEATESSLPAYPSASSAGHVYTISSRTVGSDFAGLLETNIVAGEELPGYEFGSSGGTIYWGSGQVLLSGVKIIPKKSAVGLLEKTIMYEWAWRGQTYRIAEQKSVIIVTSATSPTPLVTFRHPKSTTKPKSKDKEHSRAQSKDKTISNSTPGPTTTLEIHATPDDLLGGGEENGFRGGRAARYQELVILSILGCLWCHVQGGRSEVVTETRLAAHKAQYPRSGIERLFNSGSFSSLNSSAGMGIGSYTVGGV